MENTKRPLSLDFTKPCPRRYGQPEPSLVTPLLAITTPELNKMISGEDLPLLTPTGISTLIPQTNVLPSPLIPTTVNSNNIINNNNTINNNININNNNNANSNANINSQCNVIQKRSDKNRDLDVDKIEKKRERNRLAAKKCRQRKLETIDELRKTVSEWEKNYKRLQHDYERLELELERVKALNMIK